MATEREPQPTFISDPLCTIGLGFSWGTGNKLLVHARPGQLTEPCEIKIDNPVLLHELKWDTSLHKPITRKLVSESHNIFLSLQNHQPLSNDSIRKPQLVKFSRNYRSVLKACIFELHSASKSCDDDTEAADLEMQSEVFNQVELLWNLCEILFIDIQPGGIVLAQLLDWIKFHFHECERLTKEVIDDAPEKAEEHQSYWDALIMLILQGRINEARQLLKLHSTYQAQFVHKMDELLRKMPLHLLFNGQSLMEFNSRWRYWQNECRRCLLNGEFSINKQFEQICQILSGDDQVFQDLRPLCETWYHMLVSKLLYCNPAIKAFELQYHTQECLDMYKGIREITKLDQILLDAMEFNIHQVIKDSSLYLDSWWFVSHLTDLLYHSDHLESEKMGCGPDLREFLILEYASSLMSHCSLWQVGSDYLNFCPVNGRYYLELYLERIPLQTNKKASKVLRICQKHGMTELAQSICKILGMKSFHNGRLGSALSWALQSKNSVFASFLSEKLLFEYTTSGKFTNLDLIDNLGASVLLSDRLMLLGKYREFQKLYEDEQFQAAGSLLLSLLTARIAPPHFLMTLMMDALPLLESESIVFSSQQTYELMHAVESLVIEMQQNIEKDSKNEWFESQKDKLQLLRLALARNLARTIITEASI